MFNAQSLASSATSAATNTEQLDKASIVVEWTGTAPVGVLTVEGRSFQNSTNGPIASSWVTLDFDTIDITGASGSHQLLFNELPFSEIRLVYTRTSGTGSLTAILTAKTTGA